MHVEGKNLVFDEQESAALKKEKLPVMKLFLVGEPMSGKTAILRSFGDDTFDELYQTTIGVDFRTKEIIVDENAKYRLQLWDSSMNRQKLGDIYESYLKNAHGILIIYDISDKNSFEALKSRILPKVESTSRPNAVKMILGNKCDLKDQRQVNFEEANEYSSENFLNFKNSKKIGLSKQTVPILEVSAKLNTNITESVLQMSQLIHNVFMCNGFEGDAQNQLALQKYSKFGAKPVGTCEIQ